MQPTPAVIFDVDGVLVDSYHAHLQSWRALARDTGITFEEKPFVATFGRTSRDIIRMFWQRPGLPPLDDAEVRRLDARKEALYRDIVRRAFPAMDGAAELIDALRDAGFKLAVGSSGPPENIDLVLKRLGRESAFAARVTGEDVSRGKPDPQVFQLAAARLSAPASSCIVIEDAPAGIEAAKAAGMKAVALISTGRARREFDALACDLIVDSLRELSPAALADLFTRATAR